MISIERMIMIYLKLWLRLLFTAEMKKMAACGRKTGSFSFLSF